MALAQHYPIGSYVVTQYGLATVLEHDEMRNRLKVIADEVAWVGEEEVVAHADMPDLADPSSIEAFLTAVDIAHYDRPQPARNEACDCPCGVVGGCYRVSSNGFHMSNGDCRCSDACGCQAKVLQ